LDACRLQRFSGIANINAKYTMQTAVELSITPLREQSNAAENELSFIVSGCSAEWLGIIVAPAVALDRLHIPRETWRAR
jgi:hypothetical protein